MLINATELKKSFGVMDILTDVSFMLAEREKASIVGVNGAGKTTLLRIVNGEYEADSGMVAVKRQAGVGYLPQTAELSSENSVYGELQQVFDFLTETEAEMRRLESEMSEAEGEGLEAVMGRYSALTAFYEEKKGYECQSRIRGVIKGLGFTDEESGRQIDKLSGGQKTRVALGKLLLAEPGLLLLDEPTNHLDIAGVEWLEEYLRSYSGGILIVSHDRYFLDRVTTKTIEIENGKSRVYAGNYSFYAKHKNIDREVRMKQYLDQQKEIKRQEEFIKVQRSMATEKSVRRADSREKMLDRMVKVERPESLPDRMRLLLAPKITSGEDVLELAGVAKRFGNAELFSGVSFSVKRGEKVALIGPNGIGKTTLFRILTNRSPYQGVVRWGVNVRTGYYDQDQEILNRGRTVFEEIRESYPSLTNGEIRNILAAFVFTGDDVFKHVSALSGGEKGRASLAKLMLGGANVLILDEPTNHLDMYSKEILEEALRDFPGTALFISHDRYFINNTAGRILELGQTGVTEYLGNYDYYLEKKQDAPPENAVPADESTGTEWKRRKGIEGETRRRDNSLKRLESEISALESESGELMRRLTEEGEGMDHQLAAALYEEYGRAQEALLSLYSRLEGI